VAFLTSRPRIQGLMRWMAIAPMLSGVALATFTFSRNLTFSLACMLVVGFGVLVTAMALNTIIQVVCAPKKRGRVTSYYIICFMGMHPLGCLAAGALADRIGAPHALAIFGAVCTVVAAWLYTRMRYLGRLIRPLYERAGVLEK
jgi:predicted MFS family arabinose efflux permease